jgi:hypothetical protein
MKTGYIVSYTAFDYNDEYYSSFDDACHFEKKVYRVKADAVARALAINEDHAREVVVDIYAWTYGQGMRQFLDNFTGDMAELYRRVFRKEPGDGFKEELEKLHDLTYGLPDGETFSDEDYLWFAENLPYCRTAYVEEVEIEE